MAEEGEMDAEVPDIGQLYASVSAKALNVSSRQILSRYLNPSNTLLQNWQALAEHFGFDYMDIQNYERYADPTKSLLEDWCGQRQATLGRLYEHLRDMERWDVMEDPVLCQNIGNCHI